MTLARQEPVVPGTAKYRGNTCICVRRVRDKYLHPIIAQFAA
jgi:hypothetical protein